MNPQTRFTSRDLESMPDDGQRYEIDDGELLVSKQPHYYHQVVCSNIAIVLGSWSRDSKQGQVSFASGLIFDDDDDVAPDLEWLSTGRRSVALLSDGKLPSARELVIEVLSPGDVNRRRDREAKLKLYSRRGVDEYWIVDWQLRRIEIYRREEARLQLIATLQEADDLLSPLLPGFLATVDRIFDGIGSE
jgi:Uma2 family endonuclease